MGCAGELCRTPGLVDANVCDEVRNLLASRKGREPTGNGRNAEGCQWDPRAGDCLPGEDAANLLATADAIFRRDGRREPGEGADERVGVSQ
jgi:hypothetical protein